MFKIANFKTDIAKRGVLRTNRFVAKLTPPKFLMDRTSYPSLYQKYKTEGLSIRCETAQTPGVSLQTVEGPFRYGYGTVDKQAVGALYEPLSLTFLCDRDGEIQEFFHDWMNFIFGFSTGGKGADGDSIVEETSELLGGDTAKRKAYEVQYKSNFATDLFVEVYDEFDEKVMVYRAYKVFPERINNIDLDWNEQDSLIKMNIPFIYKDYDVFFPKRSRTRNNINPKDNPILSTITSVHSSITRNSKP